MEIPTGCRCLHLGRFADSRIGLVCRRTRFGDGLRLSRIEAQQDKGIGLRVNPVGIYLKKPQVCRLLADRFKRRSALLDTGTGS